LVDFNTIKRGTHIQLYITLLFLCFAKEKVTKRKAIFGQWLRRPEHSSTLLSQFANQLYGAGFLPTIALD
jgi:hypothetical protein